MNIPRRIDLPVCSCGDSFPTLSRFEEHVDKTTRQGAKPTEHNLWQCVDLSTGRWVDLEQERG